MKTHRMLYPLAALALPFAITASAQRSAPLAQPTPPLVSSTAPTPMREGLPPLRALAAAGAAPEGYAGQKPEAVKDDLFAGTEVFEKNAMDVTEINMDPDSLGMVGGSDAAKARRMMLNVVRTYTYEKPGMYDMADVEKIRAKLNTGDWHCSVHTRSLKFNTSTDVCSKRRTDDLREEAIITVAPKTLTFIHTIKKGYNWGPSSGMAPGFEEGTGTTMAALDAGQMARMEAQLATMQATTPLRSVDRMTIDATVAEQMRRIDSSEFRARMDALQKQFNSPEFKKQMDEMQDRLPNSTLDPR